MSSPTFTRYFPDIRTARSLAQPCRIVTDAHRFGQVYLYYTLILRLICKERLIESLNNIRATGQYSDTIISIPKPGKGVSVASLASCISQLLEKMVNTRLVYTESKILFSPLQCYWLFFTILARSFSKAQFKVLRFSLSPLIAQLPVNYLYTCSNVFPTLIEVANVQAYYFYTNFLSCPS